MNSLKNNNLTFEDKIINECVNKIDKHIIELVELKNILIGGIETKEKLSKFFDTYTKIHFNYNDVEQVKNIISSYNDIFKLVNK